MWWDTRIPPGKSFAQVIQEVIGRAECVVAVWSRQSVESRWVLDEAEEGVKRGILVPVCLDDVDIPLGFRQIQAANLVRWNGRRSSDGFQYLRHAISELVNTDQTARPSATPKNHREPAGPYKRIAGLSGILDSISKKAKQIYVAATNNLVDIGIFFAFTIELILLSVTVPVFNQLLTLPARYIRWPSSDVAFIFEGVFDSTQERLTLFAVVWLLTIVLARKAFARVPGRFTGLMRLAGCFALTHVVFVAVLAAVLGVLVATDPYVVVW
ncbi:TIR domain-containing protein [Rhodospira trueperi]|uniref:TIR domain-containing protein n=1 Tax=Rhodospira trueperi TaxID=69960 RepID=A0A1G7H5U6_9PROT|nr:TIR domain-containing protein [Rhodospira trueperi]